MKLFLTGTTGYIGGDALYLFNEAHPDWEITCLVRNSDKGAKVASQYPKAKLVYGDLDAVELIEEESKNADVVFHFANCDHMASAEAIARGLAAHTPDKPGYWIHTSGTGILTYEDFENDTFGKTATNMFDDWDNISKVMSAPDAALHRVVDKVVINAGTENSDRVKTAIVCPPCIYGPGRGPDNGRSVQVYNLTKLMLEQKRGLQVGQGTNIWTQVHVQDLSVLYLLLGEAAAQNGGKATWGQEGYYFAENGEFMWGSIAAAIAMDANKKGLLPSADLTSLSSDEAQKLRPRLQYMVGSNSRCKAIRGRKLLGWEPKERRLIDEVPDIVDGEAKSMGLIEGHAKKVRL